MADVFISYSKQDRTIAEALASKLQAEGRSVWWDTNLVGGDQFRQVIVQELNIAKSVIVIWTPNSVKSEWVMSEAQRAATQKKLLPVKLPGLAIADIPPPFDTYHTMDIGSWPEVASAVGTRQDSVKSAKSTQPSNGKPVSAWWNRLGLIAAAVIGLIWLGYSNAVNEIHDYERSIVLLDSEIADSIPRSCTFAREQISQNEQAISQKGCSAVAHCIDDTRVANACVGRELTEGELFVSAILTEFGKNTSCSGLTIIRNSEVKDGWSPNRWQLSIGYVPGSRSYVWNLIHGPGKSKATGEGERDSIVEDVCRVASKKGANL